MIYVIILPVSIKMSCFKQMCYSTHVLGVNLQLFIRVRITHTWGEFETFVPVKIALDSEVLSQFKLYAYVHYLCYLSCLLISIHATYFELGACRFEETLYRLIMQYKML